MFREIKIKNADLRCPENWIIVNPEDAAVTTEVIFIADNDTIAVYFGDTAAADLSDAQEANIRALARAIGMGSNVNIFGAVSSDLYPVNINLMYELSRKE